jgi:hypothetical protein
MPRVPLPGGGAVPRWLIVAGSAAILCHLAAILIPILDVPSGPWVTPMGPNRADPPEFAHAVRGLATPHAEYLRVAHSYQFITNRPGDIPAVEFDVRLKDQQGNLIDTLHFPDPNANLWVRHRQELLAGQLALDVPVERPGGERLPPPGQAPPTLAYWALPGDRLPAGAAGADEGEPRYRLETWSEDLVRQLWLPGKRPPDRPPTQPSEWSLTLARSYARYLCRAYGAASVEIVRHRREPVSPAVLFGNQPPPQAFVDQVASFGGMSQ